MIKLFLILSLTSMPAIATKSDHTDSTMSSMSLNFSDEFEQYWYDDVEKIAEESKIYFPSFFIDEKTLEKTHLQEINISQGIKTMQASLDKIFKTLSDKERIKKINLITLVRFIEYIKLHPPTMREEHYSVYFASEKDYIFFPVQIYRDGSIYIHTTEFDPNAASGGFKFFSRSIEYKTGKIVANLITKIKTRRALEKAIRELAAFKQLKESGVVPSIYGFDYFVSKVDYEYLKKERKERKEKKEDKAEPKEKIWHYLTFLSELFDGDLASLEQNFYKNPIQALRDINAMAHAIEKFHENKWIHRDIKLSNFFFKTEGSKDEVKLSDFGLSQSIHFENFGRSIAGTRGYMAPEICMRRINGESVLPKFEDGVLADIYSFGITLFRYLHQEKTEYVEILTKMNYMALPKKGEKKGSAEEFEKSLTLLKKEYKKELSKKWDNVKPAQKVRVHLLNLSLQMMNFNVSKRPSLSFVKSEIKKWAKQYYQEELP